MGGRNDLASAIDIREVMFPAPARMHASETATGCPNVPDRPAGEYAAGRHDTIIASQLSRGSRRIMPELPAEPRTGAFQSIGDKTG